MIKHLLLIFVISLAITNSTSSQFVTDFEEFGLLEGEALNGSDLSGGFHTGDIFLANDYNSNYMSWQGWAISAHTDTVTAGFTNDLSSISGGGANSSTTYAVSFAFGENRIAYAPAGSNAIFNGMYINNGTYAYLSMLNGDAFAKKFGGETGDDPDFFKLTVRKYLNGNLSEDSIDFYLADFRFEDNAQDYIINDWAWVDLSSLGRADSLSLTLSSSDVGQFGMNTPAYFCIDDVTTDESTGGIDVLNKELAFRMYPVPAVGQVTIEFTDQKPEELHILDASGNSLLATEQVEGIQQLNIRDIVPGAYFIQARSDDGHYTLPFVKTER